VDTAYLQLFKRNKAEETSVSGPMSAQEAKFSFFFHRPEVLEGEFSTSFRRLTRFSSDIVHMKMLYQDINLVLIMLQPIQNFRNLSKKKYEYKSNTQVSRL
jgi:hypothetical protein